MPSPLTAADPAFALAPETLAARLIGAAFAVDGIGGLIVETEAYSAEDPASHAFRGRTARNAPMFGPPGRAYVYRSYGLHWCFNIVCGVEPGGAVLIRALEPVWGLDAMGERRGTGDPRKLCSGPGRLCQALAIDDRFNDRDLGAPPFRVTLAETAPAVLTGPRIGISRAADWPRRYGLAGSAFLSRPFAASGG